MAPPGSPVRARFSVAIRTAVVDRSTRTAEYGVGSGITWDSDPEAERAELNTKALVLSAPRGDHGLIETFRWLATGTARNLEVHLARLADSADYFGFRCDAEDVRAAMQAAVGGTSIDTRVRVLLERTGQVTVQTDPLGPTDQRPIRLEIDDEPVSSADPWLRHKTTRRDVFRTRAARHPDAEQVVLVNERGELTETTVATLAVRIGGTWWTPPTRSGCLAGVERGRLLKDGAIHVRVLFVDDLTAAEDVAVISSLHGWRPAFIARASAHAASSARCAPVLGMDA
jgi:para-aminobenzoate synthetase/4-amino-4-deoxychorismate lyase